MHLSPLVLVLVVALTTNASPAPPAHKRSGNPLLNCFGSFCNKTAPPGAYQPLHVEQPSRSPDTAHHPQRNGSGPSLRSPMSSPANATPAKPNPTRLSPRTLLQKSPDPPAHSMRQIRSPQGKLQMTEHETEHEDGHVMKVNAAADVSTHQIASIKSRRHLWFGDANHTNKRSFHWPITGTTQDGMKRAQTVIHYNPKKVMMTDTRIEGGALSTNLRSKVEVPQKIDE